MGASRQKHNEFLFVDSRCPAISRVVVVPTDRTSLLLDDDDAPKPKDDLINSIDELAQDDTLSSEFLPYDADVIIYPFVDGDSGEVVFGYQEGGACREIRNSA